VNDKFVIISTYPDFDDSARAVRDALHGSRYKIAFIVASAARIPEWVDPVADKVLLRRSLHGILTFHRAKWVIITHGLYSELPKTNRQFFINLWHGMPVKKIGTMVGEQLPHTDIVVAANSQYRGILSVALEVKPEQVLVAPHPRIDIMLNVKQEGRAQHFGNKWVFLWLPTFRERKGSEGKCDGIPEQSVLHQIGLFHEFHECLKALDAVCVIKPHPMEDISGIAMNLPDTVQFWTDRDLEERALSLYQLIGMTDALITDVSSVYFEYQQLERPIFCFFPDFEAYESGRGFVRPFHTLIDAPILRTETELVDSVLSTFKGKNRHEVSSFEREGRQLVIAREVLKKCGLEIQ
jgi:CDP-glycerol glycerophosphotransferase (TagB/SpsB family)